MMCSWQEIKWWSCNGMEEKMAGKLQSQKSRSKSQTTKQKE
jgi:hypothetical protein